MVTCVVLMGTNVHNFDFAVSDPEVVPNFHIVFSLYSTDGSFLLCLLPRILCTRLLFLIGMFYFLKGEDIV